MTGVLGSRGSFNETGDTTFNQGTNTINNDEWAGLVNDVRRYLIIGAKVEKKLGYKTGEMAAEEIIFRAFDEDEPVVAVKRDLQNIGMVAVRKDINGIVSDIQNGAFDEGAIRNRYHALNTYVPFYDQDGSPLIDLPQLVDGLGRLTEKLLPYEDGYLNPMLCTIHEDGFIYGRKTKENERRFTSYRHLMHMISRVALDRPDKLSDVVADLADTAERAREFYGNRDKAIEMSIKKVQERLQTIERMDYK